MRKLFFSVLALISGGLIFKSLAIDSNANVVLEKSNMDSIYSGHHSHSSHSSHSSHAAHHSHYTCMLSRADSIGAVSVNLYNIIREGIESNPKQQFVSAFKANAVADAGYDRKNGFSGKCVFITLIEDISDAQWTDCNYRVKCIGIPLDRNNTYYYNYYEDCFSLEECESYINQMNGRFRALRMRNGYRKDKLNWMYNL